MEINKWRENMMTAKKVKKKKIVCYRCVCVCFGCFLFATIGSNTVGKIWIVRRIIKYTVCTYASKLYRQILFSAYISHIRFLHCYMFSSLKYTRLFCIRFLLLQQISLFSSICRSNERNMIRTVVRCSLKRQKSIQIPHGICVCFRLVFISMWYLQVSRSHCDC